jgi:hypothetical protein
MGHFAIATYPKLHNGARRPARNGRMEASPHHQLSLKDHTAFKREMTTTTTTTNMLRLMA